MSARTKLSLIWTYVVGAAAVVTGLAHDAVIGTQVDGLRTLSQDYYDGSLWLFLCTGTAVAFTGVLRVLGLAFKQYGAVSLLAFGVLSFVSWWLMRGARVSQSHLDSCLPARRSAPSPHPTAGR